jgi:hypothetical protein
MTCSLMGLNASAMIDDARQTTTTTATVTTPRITTTAAGMRFVKSGSDPWHGSILTGATQSAANAEIAGELGTRREGRMIDRSAISQALAKAIAYKQCGKQAEAESWAQKLVKLLECEGILK